MQALACIRVNECAEEEGDIVLEWNTTECVQVHSSFDIAVSIGQVADAKFFRICLIVDIPVERSIRIMLF